MRKLSTQKSARQVAPKPQRPSLLPPPRGFEYEAFGFLEGELVADDDNYYLIADGERLTIKGFSDRLLRTLSGQQTPITGYFGLYPKSTRSGTVFWAKCYEASAPETEPNIFRIHGQLYSTKGDEQLIRVHRNQSNSTESPFLVRVSGFLPDAKPGQFWQLECLWENKEFSLLDGQLFRASGV